MSARSELEKFVTPEIQAKVDAFIADSAGESDNVDMDEVVRQNLADHEVALTGSRPATPKVPKATTGYLSVSPDWDPVADPAVGWNPHLALTADRKAMTAALNLARQDAAFGTRVGCRKMILLVQTTYTFVEGDGDA